MCTYVYISACDSLIFVATVAIRYLESKELLFHVETANPFCVKVRYICTINKQTIFVTNSIPFIFDAVTDMHLFV